jgi:hypothetical protein
MELLGGSQGMQTASGKVFHFHFFRRQYDADHVFVYPPDSATSQE